jgi:tryptophan 2,3-dioxygenase
VTEPSGGTDYASYLLIDDLLSLQRPLTEGAHDELLFIVVHQSYELWFKLILHELDRSREALEAGRPQAAIGPLRRVVAVERLLLEHLDVLETMGPEGFLEFRDPLAPASGFQSRQFRSIEWVSGLRETWPGGEPPPGRPLYEAFCQACRAHGLDLPDGDDEAARAARIRALAELYRRHADDTVRAVLHTVAELLVDHDETIANWRYHHTLMAAREIGTRPGTGGSRGVDYLRTTIDRRFFGELWEVRVAL